MFNRNDLPHELLLTTKQKTKLRNSFNNNMPTEIKLSKAQISKIIQPGGFLGRLLGPLQKTGLSLIKIVIKLLAKIALIPLRVTAAVAAADARIPQKILGFGRPLSSALLTTTLIISNEEMNGILKILQAFKDCNILLHGLTKTIKNETKEQKGGFLSILLGTLGANLSGTLLTGKGIARAGSSRPSSSAPQNKKRKGIVRADTGNRKESDF